MRSTQARIALVVGTIAALVILFVVLSGDDDNDSKSSATNTSTSSTSPTGGPSAQTPAKPAAAKPDVVIFKNGKPQGGVEKLRYAKGDRVRLVVRSDVADEVHIHGYDLSKEVPAGGSVRFSFPAKIEGIFEIELEVRGEEIAELRVSPS